MSLSIQTPFAMPMAFTSLEESAGLNRELRQVFLRREADGQRYANPNPYTQRNRQVFESSFDLFNWSDPAIERLKKFCWINVMELIRNINNYSNATMTRIQMSADAWFHITRRGGYFAIHNHPMASWSGVYCVSDGQNDSDKSDSGLLNFVNPFAMAAMFVDAGTAQMRAPFSTHSRAWRLKPGQLVLFPSWLLHEVKPFEGEGERITVAFNAWFHLQPDKSNN